jgi:hypothetical protein
MGLPTLFEEVKPVTFAALGHINIERHLRDVHSVEDPTGRRKRKHSTASPGEPPDKQQRIDTAFKLNTSFHRIRPDKCAQVCLRSEPLPKAPDQLDR